MGECLQLLNQTRGLFGRWPKAAKKVRDRASDPLASTMKIHNRMGLWIFAVFGCILLVLSHTLLYRDKRKIVLSSAFDSLFSLINI